MTEILAKMHIFDTGDPLEVDAWQHAFDTSQVGWFFNYANECMTEEDWREMFGLPGDGNYQVLFSGRMVTIQNRSLEYGVELDEEFVLSKFEVKKITDDVLPDGGYAKELTLFD